MSSSAPASLYMTSPSRSEDGIPVFSASDRYVGNYERIAADHLASMKPGVDNPFIEDELWVQLENSTRELIVRHVAMGCRVLDVGVGLGRVLGPLNDYERYGIDISFDYLRRARAAGIEVAFARIEDMPYRDGYFDAVVACDVLEHVLDLSDCCRQILRVLRPGGTLIVRVPYLEDLSPYLDPALPYEFVHLRAFDLASLKLHFSKIFGCEFLEHSMVAPYLQGAPRLKLRPLPADNPALQLAAEVPDEGDPLSLLKRATRVSEAEFVGWIYELRDRHRETFDLVAEHLVHPIEINVVFRKPA